MSKSFVLQINKKNFYPAHENDLMKALNNRENYRNEQFAEIWLSLNTENTPSICALINKSRASVMYLRYNGDIGFSAKDLTQSNKTDIINFYLSNGQLDQHPISSTIPVNDALNALKYFYIHQDMEPSITWHDDGE